MGYKKVILDLDAVKKAVEALLTTSDTFNVGMRDMWKNTDHDDYYSYEHYRILYQEAEEINTKIQDMLLTIDGMKEEREDAEEERKREEQEAFAERYLPTDSNICSICLCDKSEHNWETHTLEMRANS
jgi:hypothetical protein